MRYVVTGGGGFLGKALSLALRRAGHDVVSISRGRYPELEAEGIRTCRLDLAGGSEQLAQAFNGAEAVFHVAAKVDMWGDYESFFRTNVEGTRAVIRACRDGGVSKLIFTSSPSVVADGSDLCGISESYPYPDSYQAFYPQTKALAEREVLAANDPNGLRTIALRPHLIFGPGDTNLIPTVIERAKAGRLVRVGQGGNLSDFTYIDDCVEAHLLALQALSTNPGAWGKPYFISQGDPVKLWWWVDQILTMHGMAPLSRSIPYRVADTVAMILESISRLRPGNPEPLLTRFLVCEMATTHYFDISAARRDLGYQPNKSVKECLKILADSIPLR